MTSTPQAEARRDAVAEQLFSSVIGALETLHVYVGRELGLYEALDGAPAMTADEFAGRAGIHPRYAREWLEQQAAAGILDVDEETGDAATRTFRLPDGVAEVVCRPDSLALVAPLAPMVVGVAKALPAVLEAFRSGGGVPYDAYGEDIRRGNRRHQPAVVREPAGRRVDPRAAGPARTAGQRRHGSPTSAAGRAPPPWRWPGPTRGRRSSVSTSTRRRSRRPGPRRAMSR